MTSPMSLSDMLSASKIELRALQTNYPEASHAYGLLLDALGSPMSSQGLLLLRQTIDALRPVRGKADSIDRTFGWLTDCSGMISTELAKLSEQLAPVVTETGSVERDYESELTGDPVYDEALYIASEYSYADQMALRLGYPLGTPLSEMEELYPDDEEEDFWVEEPE